MASNKIPQSFVPLINLLEAAADGLRDHGSTSGVLQHVESTLRTPLNAIKGTPAGPGGTPPAEPGLAARWNTAKADKVSATAVLNQARQAGRALTMACIGVLKPRLGQQWNSAWNAAGFNGSLRVLDNPMTQLQGLRAYFTSNPTHEVADLTPEISCTAAACLAGAEAISEADTESNQSNSAAGTAKAALEDAIRTARRKLTGLREELTSLFSNDDDRWLLFGFKRPSDPETPDVPENVTAVPGAPGSKMLFIDFDDAPNADNYRVLVKDATGTNVLANAIVEESEYTLELPGLVSGTQVQITVTARTTDGLESQPSEILIAALP